MRVRTIWLFSIVSVFFVGPMQQPLADTKTNTLKTTNFVISYEDIEKEQAEQFAAEAEKDFLVVTSYLGRRFAQQIHINIGKRYLFPRYSQKEGEIFVPANRIRHKSDNRPHPRKRGSALVSLIVPVVAPSTNKRWGEFLETGLRIFLQEKFGPKDETAFPMMGRDLHVATAQLAADYGKFIPLGQAEKARTWRTRLTRTRRLAYLEEGSFVRYLIERDGLKKFLKWYDGGTFDDIYSRTVAATERHWQTYLRTLKR